MLNQLKLPLGKNHRAEKIKRPPLPVSVLLDGTLSLECQCTPGTLRIRISFGLCAIGSPRKRAKTQQTKAKQCYSARLWNRNPKLPRLRSTEVGYV